MAGIQIHVDDRSLDGASDTDSLLDRLRSISMADVFDSPVDEPKTPPRPPPTHTMGVHYEDTQYGQLPAPYAQMGLPTISADDYYNNGSHFGYAPTNWAPPSLQQPPPMLYHTNLNSSVSPSPTTSSSRTCSPSSASCRRRATDVTTLPTAGIVDIRRLFCLNSTNPDRVEYCSGDSNLNQIIVYFVIFSPF